MESVYSKRIRAGKRRTYFFDVRATRSNDYYLTITESRKKFEGEGYDRHKIFLYKEDFNKFIKALTEAVDYVKTDLMPDFDFDAYNHDQQEQTVLENDGEDTVTAPVIAATPAPTVTAVPIASVVSSSNGIPVAGNDEEVDKW
jgi:hypothetical protein